jgi:hypothetical protein
MRDRISQLEASDQNQKFAIETSAIARFLSEDKKKTSAAGSPSSSVYGDDCRGLQERADDDESVYHVLGRMVRMYRTPYGGRRASPAVEATS